MVSKLVNGIGNWSSFNVGDLNDACRSSDALGKVKRVGASSIHQSNRLTSKKYQHHTFSPLRLLFLASLFVSARCDHPSGPFPATMELSSLDGTTGFIINGEVRNDKFGRSVSTAGDVNGDGIDDLLIGASRLGAGGNDPGKSYVIFGSKSTINGGILDISTLNGNNGFKLIGEYEHDWSGISTSSAGDLNNDGINDIVIGASKADSNDPGIGRSYVVFGSRIIRVGGVLELSALTGTYGFKLKGEAEFDHSGCSVASAGDVNGDKIYDIIIGAYQSSPPGRMKAGKSYVIFGNRNVGSEGILELSALNGTYGFTLNGEVAKDYFGWSVNTAGDLNGDGLADLVIGAYHASPSGIQSAGKTYVVYGKRNWPSNGIFELSSLDGTNGYTIHGEAKDDQFGYTVSSAGDLNGDGLDDIVMGTSLADFQSRMNTGKTYVIFGSRNVISGGRFDLSDLNGINGFTLIGEAQYDGSGISASKAGDVNGDGIVDLVIGAYNASPLNRIQAGKTYVVYGTRTPMSSGIFELSSLNGTNGFVLHGEAMSSNSGISVSTAGDVNGDGIDDLVIGASNFSPTGRADAGRSYVVFGRNHSLIGQSTSSTQITPSFSPFRNADLISSTHSLMINQSQTNDPTPLIAGLITAVAILACSVFGGVVFFLVRRPSHNDTGSATALDHIESDPAVEEKPTGINSLQPEMQSARNEGNYAILSISPPEGHYQDWPKEPKPHTKDQYEQVDLDQLNRERDHSQEELAAKRHEGYDDLKQTV